MTTAEAITFLHDTVHDADLWGRIAEEAAELTQAALKMQRIINGTNPPRKTYDECVHDVLEEHADLELCFKILNWQHDDVLFWPEKAKRWAGVIDGSIPLDAVGVSE